MVWYFWRPVAHAPFEYASRSHSGADSRAQLCPTMHPWDKPHDPPPHGARQTDAHPRLKDEPRSTALDDLGLSDDGGLLLHGSEDLPVVEALATARCPLLPILRTQSSQRGVRGMFPSVSCAGSQPSGHSGRRGLVVAGAALARGPAGTSPPS